MAGRAGLPGSAWWSSFLGCGSLASVPAALTSSRASATHSKCTLSRLLPVTFPTPGGLRRPGGHVALGAGRKQRLGCVLNKTTAFLPAAPHPRQPGGEAPRGGPWWSQEHLPGGRDLEDCPAEGSPLGMPAWGEAVRRPGAQTPALSRSVCFESQTPQPQLSDSVSERSMGCGGVCSNISSLKAKRAWRLCRRKAKTLPVILCLCPRLWPQGAPSSSCTLWAVMDPAPRETS